MRNARLMLKQSMLKMYVHSAEGTHRTISSPRVDIHAIHAEDTRGLTKESKPLKEHRRLSSANARGAFNTRVVHNLTHLRYDVQEFQSYKNALPSASKQFSDRTNKLRVIAFYIDMVIVKKFACWIAALTLDASSPTWSGHMRSTNRNLRASQ